MLVLTPTDLGSSSDSSQAEDFVTAKGLIEIRGSPELVSNPDYSIVPKVSNCAGVYLLEHNYIVRYIKISQLHVSALMAIFMLDKKLDEKTIYNMVHDKHKCGVRGDEISFTIVPLSNY